MACVLGGKAFAHEDVPQMTATVIADDLDAPRAIFLELTLDRAIDLIVEARPTAVASNFESL